MSETGKAPLPSGAPVMPGGAGLSARRAQLWSVLQAIGMLPVLILLCILFHVLSEGRFFSVQNLSIVAQQASINSVLGAGMTFVILTGGIDLSVGSVLAASAMSALIVSLLPDLGWLGLPAALLTGLGFGLVNGALIAFGKLPAFIVTLGSLTAVRGLARLMGGDTTIFNPDLPFAFIGDASIPVAPGIGIPVLAVIAFAVIVLSWYVLRRTVLGVRIYAVGGNAAAARLSGIKVWAVLLFVYAASGLLAGLGGAMAAARLFAANGLAVIAFAVIVLSWYVLRRTVLGVRIYAVGGNAAAARLSGIKVWAVLLFVYAASGLLAGLGGAMAAARLFAANGLQLGQSYELDAIAAVILGGTSFVGGIGSIWGTLVGALIIAVLTNGLILTGVSDIWQFIIKGLVIIGAVALDRFRLQGSART